MSGVVPIPVIRVNYSDISGECLETARNAPFPLAPVKDGNAAEHDIPNQQDLLPKTACPSRATNERQVQMKADIQVQLDICPSRI
jgi:hypothetical protein